MIRQNIILQYNINFQMTGWL